MTRSKVTSILIIVGLLLGSANSALAFLQTDLSRPEDPVMDFWSYMYSNGQMGRYDVWHPSLGEGYAESRAAEYEEWLLILAYVASFGVYSDSIPRLAGLAFRGGFDPEVEMLSPDTAFVSYYEVGQMTEKEETKSRAAVARVGDKWLLLSTSVQDGWDGFERLAEYNAMLENAESGEADQ